MQLIGVILARRLFSQTAKGAKSARKLQKSGSPGIRIGGEHRAHKKGTYLTPPPGSPPLSQLWLFAHSPSAWGPRPLPRPQKEDCFSLRRLRRRNEKHFLYVLFALLGRVSEISSPPRKGQTSERGGAAEGGGGRVRRPGGLRYTGRCVSPDKNLCAFVSWTLDKLKGPGQAPYPYYICGFCPFVDAHICGWPVGRSEFRLTSRRFIQSPVVSLCEGNPVLPIYPSHAII